MAEVPGVATGFANVIFVANLPVVPAEKFEKLVNVVRKIYSQIGVIPDGAPPCCARCARRTRGCRASAAEGLHLQVGSGCPWTRAAR